MKREKILADVFDGMGMMRRFFAMKSDPHQHQKDMPTRAQIAVMMLLLQTPQMGVKDIAHALCMTSSGATQTIDSLVTEKLLTRKADRSDRRKIAISLTARGKHVLAKAKAAHKGMMSVMFAPLSTEELLQLKNIQEKIIAHLQNV